MNLQVEHGIIALLLIALIYNIVTHYSLISDLLRVPDKGNPHLKAVKDKHCFGICSAVAAAVIAAVIKEDHDHTHS